MGVYHAQDRNCFPLDLGVIRGCHGIYVLSMVKTLTDVRDRYFGLFDYKHLKIKVRQNPGGLCLCNFTQTLSVKYRLNLVRVHIHDVWYPADLGSIRRKRSNIATLDVR